MPYVVACKYIQKVIIYFIFSCIRIKFTDFLKIYYVDKKKIRTQQLDLFQECILTLKVTSPIFKIEDTFGIPVTVKDYGKIDTYAGTSAQYAYKSPLGHVTVLVCFNVI